MYFFKVIWSKNYIAIAVDEIKNKKYSLPLTTFYFWPREDGWKLLQAELISKPWMTEEQQTSILNGYTSLINYWLVNVHKTESIKKIIQESKNLNFQILGNT
jgi:30S ribosomal protein 3